MSGKTPFSWHFSNIFPIFSCEDDWYINRTFGTETNFGKISFCSHKCFQNLSLVSLKSTVDAPNFQQLLHKICEEERHFEVDTNSWGEDNTSNNHLDESVSDVEVSSDESVPDQEEEEELDSEQ